MGRSCLIPELPNDREPLLIYQKPFARNVHRLTFTGHNQAAGDDPTEIFLDSTKVRAQWIRYNPLVVFPKGDFEWPAAKSRTPVILEVGSGVALSDQIRQAIVTVARAFNEQAFGDASPAIEGLVGPQAYWGE